MTTTVRKVKRPTVIRNQAWCEYCGQPCKAILVDFGIGPYEYFGQKGMHIDNQVASDCCESTAYADPEFKVPVEIDDEA